MSEIVPGGPPATIPFYKENPFWGAIGGIFTFILAGVGFAVSGNLPLGRVLFWIALPWALMALWLATSNPQKRIRTFTVSAILTLLLFGYGDWRLVRSQSKDQPRSYQLSFTFRDSPLFTNSAKTFIEDKTEDYFEYLERIGITPPHEMPPIGVATPDGFGGCGGSSVTTPAPSYRQGAIYFAETCLNDATEITGIYSDWVFGVLLNENLPTVGADKGNRFQVQKLLSDYYVSSFYDILFSGSPQDIRSWPVILWDIRKQFGRDFTDRSLAQAIKSMNEEGLRHKLGMPFDDYLCYHLGIGVSLIDNEHRKFEGVRTLLKMRGQCK
jgi:hypothetical protein